MKLVAVSAGLSPPSSTRLVADRLAEAVQGELAPGASTCRPRSSNCVNWPSLSPTTS